MLYISVSKFPNQEFTVYGYADPLVFRLHWFRDMTYCTVTDLSGNVFVQSQRICNGGWILPIRYESVFGNYRFEDENGEYPDYRNFDETCFLVSYSPEEMTAIRGA